MDFSSYGPTGAVVVVVLLFLRFISTEGQKRDKTYDKVAIALNKLTKATNNSTAYLKERNGRDNAFQKENIKAIKDIPNQMKQIADAQAEALKKTPVQQVREQKVEHQVIKNG